MGSPALGSSGSSCSGYFSRPTPRPSSDLSGALQAKPEQCLGVRTGLHLAAWAACREPRPSVITASSLKSKAQSREGGRSHSLADEDTESRRRGIVFPSSPRSADEPMPHSPVCSPPTPSNPSPTPRKSPCLHICTQSPDSQSTFSYPCPPTVHQPVPAVSLWFR